MSKESVETNLSEIERLPDTVNKIAFFEKLIASGTEPDDLAAILNRVFSLGTTSSKEAATDIVASLNRDEGQESKIFKRLSPELKKIPQAFEDVLIRGPGISEEGYDESILKEYKGRKRCLIIGDGKREISLEEIRSKLNGI